jgi:AhpD family alkylhydroperoxidase
MPRELATEVKRRNGMLPAWATYLAAVPWVVRATSRVVESRLAYMPLSLVDLIGLVVSRDNSCRYCYGATRTLLKLHGHRDDEIDRIERELHRSTLSRQEQIALDFARKVSHANPRATTLDRDALAQAGYTPPVVAEIAFTAAFAGFPNRISSFFALPPERFEKWVENPIVRLVRPLLSRQLRLKPVPPEPPGAIAPPCADVIAALGDSPTANVARAIVDDAFGSAILPRRTKMLMLAVIGRALGCDHAEGEAREALAPLGFSSGDIDDALANLGSAKLDRRDTLLVQFARQTVRYQPAAIQRRTRELLPTLSTEEVIEAVGVAALANAVGRLSVLLETC